MSSYHQTPFFFTVKHVYKMGYPFMPDEYEDVQWMADNSHPIDYNLVPALNGLPAPD